MQEGSMKKSGLIVLGMIAGIILTISLLWISSNHGVLAESGPTSDSVTATPTATALFTDAGAAVETLQPAGGEDESPQAGIGSQSQPSSFVLPTPIPGESLVYFVPTDNDATATVLYLYNTDSVDHTVALRGFNYDGAMVYAQNIVVPASSFRRLVSDSVAAAPPPSWATPAPITTNFTDFVYCASLSLPRGVKAEGYTLFNPGTGTVNPRLDQGAIPLRFSTDPASVFLPMVQKSP
jgi:hypothetical protein